MRLEAQLLAEAAMPALERLERASVALAASSERPESGQR